MISLVHTYNYPIQVIVLHANANDYCRSLLNVHEHEHEHVHVHVNEFDGIQLKPVRYYWDSLMIDSN